LVRGRVACNLLSGRNYCVHGCCRRPRICGSSLYWELAAFCTCRAGCSHLAGDDGDDTVKNQNAVWAKVFKLGHRGSKQASTKHEVLSVGARYCLGSNHYCSRAFLAPDSFCVLPLFLSRHGADWCTSRLIRNFSPAVKGTGTVVGIRPLGVETGQYLELGTGRIRPLFIPNWATSSDAAARKTASHK
jgi:hypothetical protein